MSRQDSLTHEYLIRLLHYDAETGIFRWKNNPDHGPRLAGRLAGYPGPKGSWRITVKNKGHLAHRLAWFYIHAEWPRQIDHINGNRLDNRLSNLRNANNSQNQANNGAKSNNRLGVRGISFRKGKFIVQLRKGETRVRARFPTLEAAKIFAIEQSKILHGDFSVHNRQHRGRRGGKF